VCTRDLTWLFVHELALVHKQADLL